MFYVYILECADGTFYIGSTNDLERRLHSHNHLKSGAHYTKIRRPVAMKYHEAVGSMGDARKRESILKKLSREQKVALFRE
jgi:putative endonuclease